MMQIWRMFIWICVISMIEMEGDTMIWQESKKLWKKPAVILAFLAISLLQFIVVWQNYSRPDRAAEQEAQKYIDLLDKDFQPMLESFVEQMQKSLAERDPNYDTERVKQAYQNLATAADRRFSNGFTFDAVISNLEFIKNCIILFLILQCAAVFTGDRETGMETLALVCKHGRKNLFRSKFFACQLSSLLLWLWINLMGILAVWFRIGVYGMDGLVQNFHTNASPFLWNQCTYLCVVGILSLISCQIVSAVIFMIGYLSKSSVSSVLSAFAILFLPVACEQIFPIMRFLFPNYLSSDYLWNHYAECRFGSYYIAEWKIALIEVFILWMGICLWYIWHPDTRMEE